MILYVNGDEHTAAAKAANDFAYANDDIRYVVQGLRPHPDNLAVSWGMNLSKKLKLGLKCDAESGASNDRIIRTTNAFLNTLGSLGNPYTVIVIGWTSWEREEWHDEDSNEWYQVSASGTDAVPNKWNAGYRTWTKTVDYRKKEDEAHAKIYAMHARLQSLGIPHLFFNSMWHFSKYQDQNTNWNGCYLDPYDPEQSYLEWTKKNEITGIVAQRKWADILFSRLTPLLNSV